MVIAASARARTRRSNASRSAAANALSSRSTTALRCCSITGDPATATTRTMSRGIRELPEATEQDLADRAVHLVAHRGGALRAELLDDERAPTRPFEHARHRDGVDLAQQCGDQARAFCRREGWHRDRRDQLRAGQLGEEGTHVMVSRHLFPTRHDETDRPVRDVADEHCQDLACPPVGPVEIFEDEDGGMWRRDGVDQGEHALEHLLGRERADRFEVRSAPAPWCRALRSNSISAAWRSGWSPSATQPPAWITTPAARASVASSVTRRVFPAPASPRTSKAPPVPAGTRERKSRSRVSCASRPMRSGADGDGSTGASQFTGGACPRAAAPRGRARRARRSGRTHRTTRTAWGGPTGRRARRGRSRVRG